MRGAAATRSAAPRGRRRAAEAAAAAEGAAEPPPAPCIAPESPLFRRPASRRLRGAGRRASRRRCRRRGGRRRRRAAAAGRGSTRLGSEPIEAMSSGVTPAWSSDESRHDDGPGPAPGGPRRRSRSRRAVAADAGRAARRPHDLAAHPPLARPPVLEPRLHLARVHAQLRRELLPHLGRGERLHRVETCCSTTRAAGLIRRGTGRRVRDRARGGRRGVWWGQFSPGAREELRSARAWMTPKLRRAPRAARRWERAPASAAASLLRLYRPFFAGKVAKVCGRCGDLWKAGSSARDLG